MDKKILKRIGKIFLSLLVIAIIVLVLFGTYIIIQYDNCWNNKVNQLIVSIILLMSILLIWSKKYKKYYLIIAIVSVIVFILNNIYYEKYASIIEPLIYLHNKYDYKISEMKITKTEKVWSGDILGQGAHPRRTTIKYKQKEILVYYDNGWKEKKIIK